MLTIQDVSAEQLANLLCNYRHALSENCNGEHGKKNDSSDDESERELMVTAVRLALLELAAPPLGPEPRRNYFATPGEADWGC